MNKRWFPFLFVGNAALAVLQAYKQAYLMCVLNAMAAFICGLSWWAADDDDVETKKKESQ